MAKAAAKKAKEASPRNASTPKFPYTTKPASLRRLLKAIPTKPRPPKFDKTLLRSWGFGDNNDMTMLRVLKAVNLINDRNEPTDVYVQFMRLGDGPAALGPELKRLYEPLFNASLAPFSESNEQLQNLFNIHSGGAPNVLNLQMQTFKALAENASFNGGSVASASQPTSNTLQPVPSASVAGAAPAVNINLHIHLPENKSRREYEDMIEDIGRYIFGRNVGDRRE